MSEQVDEMSVSGGDALDRARSLLAEADAGEITPADEDTIRGLVAEIERLRCVVECVKADLAYERGRVSVYEAEIDRLGSRLAAAERREDAWMNGVADAVEPLGFDRRAACGPADLLPGLKTLTARLAAAERVCEVAAKRLEHYIDMPLAEALDALRAARGGDAR